MTAKTTELRSKLQEKTLSPLNSDLTLVMVPALLWGKKHSCVQNNVLYSQNQLQLLLLLSFENKKTTT